MLNLIVSLLILPLMATDTAKQARFTPKDLPYAYDALAPQVSEETLRFHHDKHYVGYVNKLNELIVDTPYAEQPLEDIVVSADGAYSHDCGSCSSCKGVRAKLDSRHYVLGGALLSTAVFGFPVFCLVCPIGLTFATVLVVWRLFAAGDMTWSVVLIPLLLVVELVFLRKWCTRFCPMAGLMNLVSRFSKTWRPVIDESKCLETVNGAACSKCAIACEADINLRHPDFGERTLADCTRCRACVDACPAKAVSMPFLVKKGAGPQASTVVLADIDEKTAE